VSSILGQRNVVLAMAICLPLITVHYLDILDLGYFVFVPTITLGVILLNAVTGASRPSDEKPNG
jgi:hypothetical protein